MKKARKHLSITGIGPVCFSISIVLTIIGVYLTSFDFMQGGEIFEYKIISLVLGFILIAFGIIIYLKAIMQSKIIKKIKSNTLVTTGVYSWVRNPIYSAFFIISTGCLLLLCNIYLIVLPLTLWLLLTILIVNTEEKWLIKLYGHSYLEYMKRVNRVIPWFPRK